MKARRAIWTVATLIIAINFLYWFVRASVTPALSALLGKQLDPEWVGLLLASVNLIPLFLSITGGSLGDKLGHGRVLSWGAGLMFVAAGIFKFAHAIGLSEGAYLVAVSLGLLVSGLGWMLLWIALQTLVALPFRPDEAPATLSVKRMVNALSLTLSLGGILGPLAMGQLIDSAFAARFWDLQILVAGAIFAAAATIAALEKRRSVYEAIEPAPGPPQIRRRNPLVAMRQQWPNLGGAIYTAALLSSFVLMFAISLNLFILPAYLEQNAVTAATIGYLIMAGQIVGALIRLAMILDWLHLEPRSSLAIALIAGVLGVSLLGVVPPGPQILICSVLLGLSVGIGEPLALQLIAEYCEAGRRGLAMGGRVLVNRLAMTVGPIGAGALLGALGGKEAFLVLGLFLAALSWPCWRLLARQQLAPSKSPA